MRNQSKGQEGLTRLQRRSKWVPSSPSQSGEDGAVNSGKGEDSNSSGGPRGRQAQHCEGLSLIPILQRTKLRGREVKSPGWDLKPLGQMNLQASCRLRNVTPGYHQKEEGFQFLGVEDFFLLIKHFPWGCTLYSSRFFSLMYILTNVIYVFLITKKEFYCILFRASLYIIIDGFPCRMNRSSPFIFNICLLSHCLDKSYFSSLLMTAIWVISRASFSHVTNNASVNLFICLPTNYCKFL